VKSQRLIDKRDDERELRRYGKYVRKICQIMQWTHIWKWTWKWISIAYGGNLVTLVLFL